MNNQYGPGAGYRPPQASYPYDSGNTFNTPQTAQAGLDMQNRTGRQVMNGQTAAGAPPYPYMAQNVMPAGQTAGQTGSYIPQTPYSAGYGQPYAQQMPGAGMQNRSAYEQQAYAQAQGFTQPQNYAQAPYAPNAYQQPAQGQMPYPQGAYFAQNAQAQSFTQPQNYAQAPYTQQNYAQQGFDPLGQMGRQQNRPMQQTSGYNFRPSQQIPLNGGGYVPDQKPLRKKPFVFDTPKLCIMCAVLVVLFAAGMLTGMAALKGLFIAAAAASVVLFWVKPLISGSSRLCFSAVFGVFALVALVSILASGRPAQDPANRGGNGTPGTQTQTQNAQNPGTQGNGDNITVVNGTSVKTPEPADESEDTTEETIAQLQSFFYFWSANKQDEMLSLCLPSWQSSVSNAKQALFSIMQNRTPLDYTMENISGTKDDMTRTVTVTSTISKNNSKAPNKYRMSVIMTRENNTWYVDPRSLTTYEAAETTSATATPGPTPTPQASSSTVLYYNPNGGTKYHLDQNCKSTHSKYLPMSGKFTYGQVNDNPYSKLAPCNVCAAPLR